MMVLKFIGTLICFISVSSFEIKDFDSVDFEVVDQQVFESNSLRMESDVDHQSLGRSLITDSDSFDFEVIDEFQDWEVLKRTGLRRNLLADSDSDEVLNEDKLKKDESLLRRAGFKLLADSDSDDVLNEDELKEDEFVLKNTGLRRRLSTDSDDYHYFLWLFGFFVFIFASKCLWGYIKDLNEIQLDTLISNSVV